MGDLVKESRDGSWFDRLDGVVPSGIPTKSVAIIGCGSVGSFVADELARAGISKFLLIDPDIVEWRNLTRTIYGYAAVGQPKVDALKTHLMSIFPDVSASTLCIEVQRLRPQLRDLLGSVDLVVSALDDPEASGIVDRYCYALSKPALFVGIYNLSRGKRR